MTGAAWVPGTLRRAGIALVAIAVAGAGGGAQTLDTVYTGRILGHLTAAADSTEHYAVYASRRYNSGTPAPLLLLLDPIGRADTALTRVERAVERFAWVAMASYSARADNTPAANEHVVNVMLSDAFSAFDLDTGRVYIAGLGGTADDAWIFAYGSAGHIPGIVSVGGAGPPDSAWRARHRGRPPFDVALMAGNRGFGYEDVMTTARALRADSVPHRLDVFAGGADWPPEPDLAQALGWFEARAMARHLRPLDQPLVDSLFAVDSAAASALEGSGHVAQAADRWANAAVAWAGTHDVAYAGARASALAADPAIRLWRAERDSLIAATGAWRSSLIATLIELRQRPGVPDLRRLSDGLRIAQLQQWSANPRDSLRADWAARRLVEVFGLASFYEPEAYINVRDVGRALAMLDVAAEIQPGSPQICREEARAYALQGDGDRTLTALRCAVAGGTISMQEIRADPRYKFMEARDDYMKFIGKTGG